jgi:hypothetical protein
MKVSTLASLLFPSSNLYQGEPTKFLSATLRTYWHICTLDPLVMFFFSPKSSTSGMAIPTITLLDIAHPHAQLVTSFHNLFHMHNHQIKARYPLSLLHYEFITKQSLLQQLDSIVHLMEQLANICTKNCTSKLHLSHYFITCPCYCVYLSMHSLSRPQVYRFSPRKWISLEPPSHLNSLQRTHYNI